MQLAMSCLPRSFAVGWCRSRPCTQTPSLSCVSRQGTAGRVALSEQSTGALPEEVDGLLTAAAQRNLSVVGVSFHVGSGASDASAYHSAISAAHEILQAAASAGRPMLLLDIGGGFTAPRQATAPPLLAHADNVEDGALQSMSFKQATQGMADGGSCGPKTLRNSIRLLILCIVAPHAWLIYNSCTPTPALPLLCSHQCRTGGVLPHRMRGQDHC